MCHVNIFGVKDVHVFACGGCVYCEHFCAVMDVNVYTCDSSFV